MSGPLFETRLTLHDDGTWTVAHTIHRSEPTTEQMHKLIEGAGHALRMIDELSASDEAAPATHGKPGDLPVNLDPVTHPNAVEPDGDQTPDAAA